MLSNAIKIKSYSTKYSQTQGGCLFFPHARVHICCLGAIVVSRGNREWSINWHEHPSESKARNFGQQEVFEQRLKIIEKVKAIIYLGYSNGQGIFLQHTCQDFRNPSHSVWGFDNLAGDMCSNPAPLWALDKWYSTGDMDGSYCKFDWLNESYVFSSKNLWGILPSENVEFFLQNRLPFRLRLLAPF